MTADDRDLEHHAALFMAVLLHRLEPHVHPDHIRLAGLACDAASALALELKARRKRPAEPDKCTGCEADECEDRLPPEPRSLGSYPRLCPNCARRAPRACPYREKDPAMAMEICTAAGVKSFNPTGRCMDCPATWCVDCRKTIGDPLPYGGKS